MEINHLEARVAQATQTLAGRKSQVSELESFARRLETELHDLNKECERVQGELEGANEQIAGLNEKSQQVAGENKRLISENSRFRKELERIEEECAELREERGRLARLLGALVDAVEKNAEMPAELAQVNQGKADVIDVVRNTPAASGSAETGKNGANGKNGAGGKDGVNGHAIEPDDDEDSDIPNEAARRLMDRIRERIEAHRA